MLRSARINPFPPPPLNKSHSTFDRELLIPQSIPVTDGVRMHRLLQVAASASQLGDARDALACVRHSLKHHNFSSDKMAA
jgi:hypothetical protein